MKRMPVISGLEMVKVLYRKGWKPVRQVGTRFDYEEGWRAGSSLNSDEG